MGRVVKSWQSEWKKFATFIDQRSITDLCARNRYFSRLMTYYWFQVKKTKLLEFHKYSRHLSVHVALIRLAVTALYSYNTLLIRHKHHPLYRRAPLFYHHGVDIAVVCNLKFTRGCTRRRRRGCSNDSYVL